MESRVVGLFPTPLMHVQGFLAAADRERLLAQADAAKRSANTGTELLSHTEMLELSTNEALRELCAALTPHLVRFGELLFAQALEWTVKEAWLNVLEQGGSQFMHTHANSFVSGIVYLNRPHATAGTLFRKATGGGEFLFRNDVPLGHVASDSWQADALDAGDLVLYPSHLMHGVPPNQGGRRVTLAFNCIPDYLDSLGYRVRFSPG